MAVPLDLTENSVDISPDNSGGLLKVVLKEGDGESLPHPYDEVGVHYVGTFPDGIEFDNSRSRDEKFVFKLDDGRVIKGWDIGIATMKKGEVCRLICKPAYGYGQKGHPPTIPPNSTLIFVIEMIGWKGEDLTMNKDGGVIRTVLKKGTGSSSPNMRSLVKVNISGYCNDRLFDTREVEFNIGDGFDYQIPDGVERAIRKMKKDEKSCFEISAKYGFGRSGCECFEIKADSSLRYEVHLIDFTKAKDNWELSAHEKVELASNSKDRGTERLKAGHTKQALVCYVRGRNLLDDDPNYSSEELSQKTCLLLALNLNCALCQLKLEQWNAAVDSCDFALSYDSNNEKAYYRRAQACMGRHDWLEAIVNFERVIEINSSNKSAQSLISQCKDKLKQNDRSQKDVFKGMFDKFAEQDTKTEALQKAKGYMNEEPIGYWSNDMADGMMSLQQEMEAFGERMPASRSRRSSSGNEDDTPRQG